MNNQALDQALWIYDSGCSTDEIAVGVAAAHQSLETASVTAADALAASLAKASDEPFNAAHADAWDDAERAALIACNAGPAGSLAAA